jgi:hypothetical protein
MSSPDTSSAPAPHKTSPGGQASASSKPEKISSAGTFDRLETSDYPALFRAADSASSTAQRAYLRLTTAILGLLVAGAAFAGVSGEFPASASAFAIAGATVLAASLLLSVYRESLKLEHVWYGGRAVAEIARSMMWRYVTNADPYPIDLSAAEADKRFLSDLASIAKERKGLAFVSRGQFAGAHQISNRMREARLVNLVERKQRYLVERVQDQRLWYGRRTKSHNSAGNLYFIVIVASQLFALTSAIALVHWPGAKIQLTGLFASAASALIAWLQIKQHKELAHAYAAAEMELSFVEEGAAQISSDRDLSDFVASVESAIARENTVWVSKRERG